ncbi:hypothetical protein Nepgr_029721 [Nepenthes gracilis]|uniref:Uncharacterized protein n=1 Tax=Nepenthes gracilis TaxID=150966 RepID=A0AAD3TEV1_NEPGR|nr:hypothetical protein Nepgr_029721 [Nepenthes gracilis]
MEELCHRKPMTWRLWVELSWLEITNFCPLIKLESTTRDLATLEAVDKQELSPTAGKSSLSQLPPDGMVATIGNLELPTQVVADLALGLDYRFFEASWLSLARDSVSLEAVDQLLLSPSSTISSSAQLFPAGMDAAPGSYATIMMREPQTNRAEVPGSGGLPLLSGGLSSCPSMGKLNRNLDVIRKQLNASRACDMVDFSNSLPEQVSSRKQSKSQRHRKSTPKHPKGV